MTLTQKFEETMIERSCPLEAGNDLAVVQKLVGHEDVNTTMIYAHGDRARGFSPLDFGATGKPVLNPAAGMMEVLT